MDAALAAALTAAIPLLIICLYGLWRQKPEPDNTKHPPQEATTMDTVSINLFMNNLKTLIEQSVSSHTPIKVTRQDGDDFVVLSAADWEREQQK